MSSGDSCNRYSISLLLLFFPLTFGKSGVLVLIKLSALFCSGVGVVSVVLPSGWWLCSVVLGLFSCCFVLLILAVSVSRIFFRCF